MTDTLSPPPHYDARFGAACLDFTKHMGYVPGTAFWHIWRHLDTDDPREDLNQAVAYLEVQRRDRLPTFTYTIGIGFAIPLYMTHVYPTLMAQRQPEVFWALGQILLNRPEDALDIVRTTLENTPPTEETAS